MNEQPEDRINGAGERGSSLFDQIGIADALRRRAMLIVLVAVAVASVAAWYISKLPDIYVARAIVNIEKRRLPKSFTDAGVVVPPLSEAIGSLRQEALSRDIMRGLITELNINGGNATAPPAPTSLWEQLSYVDPVESVRKSIEIAILRNQDQEFLEISARSRDGATAARVVNRMVDILSEKNRDLRLRLAGDVNAFLDGELEKSRARLAVEDLCLQKFRGEHGDVLPETQERLFERLRTLAVRAEERRGRLDEARERLAGYELEVEGLRARSRIPAAVPVAGAPAPTVVEPRSSDALELETLRRRQDELETKYTPDHPERISVAARIAAIEDRLRASADRSLAADPAALAAVRRARAEAKRTGQPAPAAPVAARRPMNQIDRADPFYAKKVIADLIENGAVPETIGQAERLLAAMVAQEERIAGTVRDGQQETEEIARLERERTDQAPLRREYEKVLASYDAALRANVELTSERANMQRYVEAEKVLEGDRLRPIEAAVEPAVPSEPRRGLLLGMSLLGALGLGLGIGYLVELRATGRKRDAYSNSAAVEADLGVPVLAVLPTIPRPHEARNSPILAEQLNRVRHRAMHHPRLAQVRSILITSAVESEGKTTVSIGLARAFAGSLDDRALLIEADLHRPSISRALGLTPRRGLTEHLVDGQPLAGAIRVSPKLFVVSAGERPVPAATVVSSRRMQHLIEELRAKNPDWTLIIDAPPMGSTLEPLNLAQNVDGVILVIRADQTPRVVVQQALRELPAGKLLGIVLNGISSGREEPRLFGTAYNNHRGPRTGNGNGGSPGGNGNGTAGTNGSKGRYAEAV